MHVTTLIHCRRCRRCCGCCCCRFQGRGEEAEPLYKQAVTVQRRVLGDDHIDTLLSIFNWADCLENLGRHAEALPAWVELVERQERTRGVDDEGTVDSRRRLASCRRRVEEGEDRKSVV